MELEVLEKLLNYKFKDIKILEEAMLHKSYYEGLGSGMPNNERLEFLGDSVINILVTKTIFKQFPNLKEGDLSKMKAHLISCEFLYQAAISVNMQKYIVMGKGEMKNYGQENKRIISSLFEAVAGAIFADGGYEEAQKAIIPFFQDFINSIKENNIVINDYKSELQEIIQARGVPAPKYKIEEEIKEKGEKSFIAQIYLEQENIWVKAKGKNKKQAEQAVAREALLKMDTGNVYQALSDNFLIKKS